MFKYALFLLLYVATLTKPQENSWKITYIDPEYANKKLVLQVVKKDSLYEVFAVGQPNDKLFFRYNDAKRQIIVDGEDIKEKIQIDDYLVIPPKFDIKYTKSLQPLHKTSSEDTPLKFKRKGKKVSMEQDVGIFAEYGEVIVE
jgi:hypothetical protein